jgi:hypothetical protein
MSFETSSLLLNWVELGALIAILFRLSSTFELIASTQRELRRALAVDMVEGGKGPEALNIRLI